MYVKYRTYDGRSHIHIDHRPDDFTTRGDQSHINPWESTMLVPTWDAFLAASEEVTWCVIQRDNYCRDDHADHLISMGHTEREAAELSDKLNDEVDSNGNAFFTYIPTTSRLSLGMIDCM